MQQYNGLKTAVLLGGLSGLILLAGRTIGGSDRLIFALLIALGVNGFSYFYSDKLALRSMRAYPVSQVEQPRLYAIVAELAATMRMPMPGSTSVRPRPLTRSRRAATRATRRSAAPRASWPCSTSASCAASWATSSPTSATATS